MPEVTVRGVRIGAGHPCFVIAEIGINHNGSLEIAKKLIDAAKSAGCDAVKFQKRTIDIVYSAEDLARKRPNPFGTTNGDLKRGLELDRDAFAAIDAHCKEAGIMWFASCWDEPSVDFIEMFAPPCYKIASATLTDRALLTHIRRTHKTVLLSTGMSTMRQIRRAIEILGHGNLVLLHCVATYPTKDEELNLAVIKTLQYDFPDIPIGYSGHGYGTTPSVCAVAMGACVVERHLTLDRAMWGSDHAASLEPAGMAAMVKNIRRLEAGLGSGEKVVLDSEIPIQQKLRRKTDF